MAETQFVGIGYNTWATGKTPEAVVKAMAKNMPWGIIRVTPKISVYKTGMSVEINGLGQISYSRKEMKPEFIGAFEVKRPRNR